jgi:hypothetical protein
MGPYQMHIEPPFEMFGRVTTMVMVKGEYCFGWRHLAHTPSEDDVRAIYIEHLSDVAARHPQ